MSEPSEPNEYDTSYRQAIPIIYDSMGSPKCERDFFIERMDCLERHVERIRSSAAYLEEEKDAIVVNLECIRQCEYIKGCESAEKEDLLQGVDRLVNRISSVDVHVNTMRDYSQEEALAEVNSLIDKIIVEIANDVDNARIRLLAFINTCASQDNGPIDKSFEQAILGCTLDDQKSVRKRLMGLKDYLDKTSCVPLND